MRISGCFAESHAGGVALGVQRTTLRPCFCGESDDAIEPVEIVFAFFGLHESPGEFGEVDVFEAELFDVGDVALPLRFGPGFGVVIDADGHEALRREGGLDLLGGELGEGGDGGEGGAECEAGEHFEEEFSRRALV